MVRAIMLGSPPMLEGKPAYQKYKPWLLRHFHEQLCSYCLLHDPFVEIEHYEPVAYDATREHDPTNLLLGCRGCNRGKSDYHPAHAERRRMRADRTGFEVIDIRRDDFAGMFSVAPNGSLKAVSGRSEARAAWNIALLGLDLRDERRADVFRLLEASEIAVAELQGEAAERAEGVLSKLVPVLAKCSLFFDVYGVSLSSELQHRVDQVLANLA